LILHTKQTEKQKRSQISKNHVIQKEKKITRKKKLENWCFLNVDDDEDELNMMKWQEVV